MLKVTKFGGSSLSNPTQWEKVKDIVLSDESRKVVVVSALGKDDERVAKITDLFLLLYKHIELGIDHITLFENIKKRFLEIKNELELSINIEKDLDLLEKELNKKISKDYLVSRGEYLTAKLMSDYLGYYFLDSAKSIFVDFGGSVNYGQTSMILKEAFLKHKRIVVPGFYGMAPMKKIKLFSRGGSDITGSIISKVLNVDLYENWTDVNGLSVADPHVIKDVDLIKQITYSELRELSYRGANVIHEETIIPLIDDNIPLLIKNTNNPFEIGTTISNVTKDGSNYITAITGKKDFVSFNIVKNTMVSKVKVLTKVLNVFNHYNVNIENIPSGIDSFSVVVEGSQVKNCNFELINEIYSIPGVQHVEIEEGISLIAVVGRNMANIPGVAGALFKALGDNNVNIKIIVQSTVELSIIVGVSNDDYESALNIIYKDFYLVNKR